ncbi:metalloregulator ArsR/SmtB family transcription factor [Nocardia sp. CDC159]|uniref:Metalloregulator ArsR/SmtB family transcription factor n=1 Tax=Nocardia pulmonis TaxID=2951408 RepID=A0A9X2E7H6_9NOCA|nr:MULTISPECIES: metalloregulator ArsR/SmtB family transcription factor [Nocardia]MCM6774285.1 metalloregulator ArsR/SmtB family transcription factor [Nocardia pulmonis]MCM6787172.1 metalloregulator ArsR/SmtB family transcription factor [Nocardia sp. CDC159]
MPHRVKSSSTDLVFGALANPTRREILDLLLDGEQTVQAIADRFDMARPSVSEHLKVLRDCGLVAEEKRGRYRYYRVEPQPLHELQTWLDPFERFWRARLRDLGTVLDTMSDSDDRTEAER